MIDLRLNWLVLTPWILQAASDHPASYCVNNLQSAQSFWLWFSAIIPNSKPFNVLMMYTNGEKMDLAACD